ncbi:MAG: MerR family transcriptional regulator [Propionibacteriaceae bacterium]
MSLPSGSASVPPEQSRPAEPLGPTEQRGPVPPSSRSTKSTARSIGQVLSSLKADFPDISISKIRFLETEGLIAPERAVSGYRRYSPSDVERLRYVLSVQRDHYLPLKVIREHLDMMDRGMSPPTIESIRPVASDSPQPSQPPTPAVAPPKQPLRLSRADLLEASGLSEAALVDLERTQIVVPKRGTSHYGREALTLAIAAKKMAEYGIDSRHLRAFKMSADREVGLVEQAIAPHVRRAGGNKDVSGEVTQLVISFHAALVRTAMER